LIGFEIDDSVRWTESDLGIVRSGVCHPNIVVIAGLVIKELKMINYGITFVVSDDIIADFFKREEENLRQLGYYNISQLIR